MAKPSQIVVAGVKAIVSARRVPLNCLFLINGLGMGNSTRCHAVMEHLAAAGCRVHVLTSGNGLAYFKDRACVESLTQMESFYYSHSRAGRISGWSTLKSVGSLAGRAKAKHQQLARLLDELKPDVAVTDSEYMISPLRRRKIPVVAINNSEVVVNEYLKRRKLARSIRSHFWFVEYFDYLFHRQFVNLVLSPFPQRTPTRHPRFRRIGLIVRPEIKEIASRTSRAEFPSPRQLRTVVFMLSGSVHASQVDFDGRQFPFKVEVVGRSGESHGNVTFHGRQMDNRSLLARADAYVINGGYSALSEAFAFRKPTFVLPVPGHAEQFLNACLAEDFGLGLRASEADVVDRLLRAHELDEWTGLKPAPAKFEIDGDLEAAEAILQFNVQPRKILVSAPLPVRRPTSAHSAAVTAGASRASEAVRKDG